MSKKQVFQFLDAPREMPRKLPLALRTAGDWSELYGAFAQPEASHQAGRPAWRRDRVGKRLRTGGRTIDGAMAGAL